MSLDGQAEPQRIPPPEDFPVVWEDPEDEKLFWQLDPMHFPNPMPLLEFELTAGLQEGFGHALREYEIPVSGFRWRRINTFWYSALIPLSAPAEEMNDLERRAEEKLMPAMAGLGEAWERRFLPEIEEHLGAMASRDLTTARVPELALDLNDAVSRLKRLWELHFLIVLPSYLAISEFDEMYRELFPSETPDGAFGAYRLLGGFPNKTLETGQALWSLSRRALGMPEVRRVLEREAAGDVPAALEGSDRGRAFLADLHAYLETYGERGDLWGITHPAWVEDPTPVLKNLKDYLTQPDDADPGAEMRRRGRDRDRAVSEARRRLDGYPRPVREQFEFLLEAAQTGVVLSEDHGFYIDFRGVHRVRRIILEIARRLANAGALGEVPDVFLLTLDELNETLEGFPALDRRQLIELIELIERRRAEMERFRGVRPPPALGTAAPGPLFTDAFGRLMDKFFGAPPPPESEEPGVLRGSAGSPGKARGRARLIRSIAEAGKLAAGDILVAETTAPPWTPLFASVAAVVTDTGGILSHCAVVAREYGIPAVVGVGVATAAIRDGQMIEVDGDAGVVRTGIPA